MLEIYTDGSCSTNTKQGGWGYVVLDCGVKIKENCGYEIDTTNNRMELTAFCKALNYIKRNYVTRQDCIIYTDSAYIANCFNQGWYKRWRENGWRTANRVQVKNQDLWQEILNLYESSIHTIEIAYVKGHALNKWNERADTLATSWRGIANEKTNVNM